MATHYIENGGNVNEYYFDSNVAPKTTSQVQRSIQDVTYASPVSVSTTVASTEFSSHPVSVSDARAQPQQIRLDRNAYVDNDSYQLPQQHQSVAGFSKSASQQQHQSSSSPVPQVKATVRAVSSPEQQHVPSVQYQSQPQQQPISTQRQQQVYANYEQQGSTQSVQVLPQHQQHQYDSRQQLGQSAGISNYYPVANPVQYINPEVDQRTESSSRGRDPHVQIQQVPVRQLPASQHQQNESSANYQQQLQQPQQHVTTQPSPKPAQQQQQQEDQLQQYYSQLTSEQYQQLLRQQQIQRQQQEEQKRQQLAQQQYYVQQQQQERQRIEQQQQQQQQYQPSRSNQEAQNYDESQQRRVHQSSSAQDHYNRQQGQDQYDAYHSRPQPVQTSVLTNTNQDSYRQQQQQQQHGQQGQQDAYYEQQRRVVSQVSPTPTSTYQQEQSREQHRSTATISGPQQYQQIVPNQQHNVRTDFERQCLDEQEYYAVQLARQQQQEREHAAQIEVAQRQLVAQRAQQQEREHNVQIETNQQHGVAPKLQSSSQHQQQFQEQQQQPQTAQPVGIRGLMNKFTGPSKIPTFEPRNKTTVSHQRSSSSHTSSTGRGQTTTTTTIQNSKTYSMTYSALPKPSEPPVNSAEYYQMLHQGNINATPSNVQQSAAPPHIQGPPPGFGALRDRFKSGSVSDSTNPMQDVRRQQQSNAGNSGLGALRDQYMHKAKESIQTQEESFSQRIQNVSQSASVTNQSLPENQQVTAAPDIHRYDESQVQSQSVDDQLISSEDAVAEGGSSSGASPIENDTHLTTIEAT